MHNCSCTDSAMVKMGEDESSGAFDRCSCLLGHRLVGDSACEKCSVASYLDVVDQASCKGCNAGRTTNGTGASKKADCVCVEGMAPSSSTTQKCVCPKGYKTRPSGMGCDVCEAGRFQPKEDQSSCDKCPPEQR